MPLPFSAPVPAPRRQFLVAAGLATALGQLPAWARLGERPAHNPFTLGVASGDPEPDNVLLWTRLTPPLAQLGETDTTAMPALRIRWELAHDPLFRQIVRSGEAMAQPEWGHGVHVQVGGLAPDRWYHYRFMLGQAVSSTGRCRTAPAPGSMPQRLRLAYASCQRWEHGYYAAWRQVVQDAPDLVLFLGDYIYEYATPAMTLGLARTHNLRAAQSLQDYRDRYALHKSDPLLQAAHAMCNWSVGWDDHEVENNYAGDQGQGDAGRFLARRMAAWQAFYENMPLRASALTGAGAQHGGGGLQLYRSLQWGRLARLHFLDGRQYRSAQACRAEGAADKGSVRPAQCAALSDTARSFLGWTQEQWLYRQLAEDARQHASEGPRWSILAQPTLVSTHRPPSGSQATDSWDGYPAARQRLVRHLTPGAQPTPRNSVLLGGDLHQNYVCAVHADPEAAPERRNPVVASEFCSTSITSRSGTTQAKVDAIVDHNPQVLYARCEERGYGLADITPERWTSELRAVANPMRADSRIYTLARFTVEDRRPGPVAS
ncbi:alkaline phosphatase D family protein [Delftia tsuruhatensis]|uniref:alkaline phosphatase D family protein n=1 Tax=Delftia tsuruhatensis TaxID=180282 RepID=UPI0024445872|nr:alkaline phosphatase D family protein [Delftia tsuruhatensis]MDH0774281.1 alkaline phosphatase D family protein [Delftia tsuruhatensis]MDH1458018.1 alkaline phosphatase D family protein [Delftia tsuruhatensis]MDH1823422.1 alkaline phosphatase D family protein [Delftia tsuruhatensis]WGG12786.1 alkaline phosphatase D family protein [Delftia tsuruhatensis]